MIFFFKQKTAYDMRISDWSSDVCSSDLIENILDAAKAANHIASPWENPARWKGNLIHLLPRRRSKKDVKHHAAMPFEDLPDFWRRLRQQSGSAARALELTILCATRTSETLDRKRVV